MIVLGSKVRDRVTGFEGVATSRGQYITGPDRYGVEPIQPTLGQSPELGWFDEERLEVIKPA